MAELILTHRGTVYPHQHDHMGHVNVMWYVQKFDEATWQLFARFGMTRDYMREHGRGMAAVRQEIDYRRELVAGDLVTVRSGLLEVRERVVRYCHEMREDLSGEIAARCVMTTVCIDTATRRACPLAAEHRERARALLVDDPPE